MDIVEELANIYATKGLATFEGDRICTQTARGLQTAQNAENDGASAAMVTAAGMPRSRRSGTSVAMAWSTTGTRWRIRLKFSSACQSR